DPVNLLRHSSIEGPKSCLYMGNCNMQLSRCQCTGHRRVSVAVDDHHVGLLRDHYELELFQHSTRHCAVAKATDLEIVDRFGNVELLEEHLRHQWIEVLTSMDEDLCNAFTPQRTTHGRRLDELRPCTDDCENARHSGQGLQSQYNFASTNRASRG